MEKHGSTSGLLERCRDYVTVTTAPSQARPVSRRVVVEARDAVEVGVDDDGGRRQRSGQPVDVGPVTVDDAVVVETAARRRTGGAPAHRQQTRSHVDRQLHHRIQFANY